MPNRLYDLEVERIDLVDTPAIRRRFLIVKQETEEEILKELEETIAAVTKARTDEEKQKLSDKAINAIKGALNLLNKYKDELPSAARMAIDALAKLVEGYGYGYGYGYATPQKGEGVAKAGAAISAARKQQIESVISALRNLAGDLEKMLEEAAGQRGPDMTTPAEAMAELSKMLRDLRENIVTADDLQALIETELKGFPAYLRGIETR